MRTLSQIGTTIDSYVKTFSNSLADKVSSQSLPLHDPAKQPRHERLMDIAVKPFDKQADTITACVKSLDESGLGILACQMGTGKSMMSISTVHCHAKRSNYTALVMCPPHLAKKWRDEIRKFLGDKTRVTIIENWEQFIALRYGYREDDIPTWYIMAETTAKLSHNKRCAVIPSVRKIKEGNVTSMVQCITCPKCAGIVRKKDKDRTFATVADVARSWMKCNNKRCAVCTRSLHPDAVKCNHCDVPVQTCNEPLWQPSNHKISPAHYAKVKNIDWFDYVIRDEAHNSKGADTADANAFLTFAALAKYVILATGTLLAGKSEDLRPLLFRLKPRQFVKLGFSWKDEIPFARTYGRLQTVIRTSEGGTKRRSSKGSSKSTSQSIKAGIMPQLFPDFVANFTCFLALPDLTTNLPSYTEETVAIDMEPPMLEAYADMKSQLLSTFRDLYQNNRKMAMRMMGGMLESLLTWPDVPFDRKPVTVTDDFGRDHHIYLPVSLDKSAIYPKERKLIEMVMAEKKAGRKAWVYAVRDDTRGRLQTILEAHGLKVAHLESQKVTPCDRLEWLAEEGPGCDVGMSHPQLVETGIEMFGPGFNFPTLIWYSTGFKLNTLRQASRRSWRIGQAKACRTVYLYYGDSAQSTAIGVMASKLVAAEAIEGKFSDGGLADESQDEDIALAVARSLADNITVKVPVSTIAGGDRLSMLRERIARLKANLGK